MCTYLGAETVAVDAAKPRRTARNLFVTGTLTLIVVLLMAGCSGLNVGLGSPATKNGDYTDDQTPIVQEVTWIDLKADELVANYQQYIGKEVYVRDTTVVSKELGSFVIVGDGNVQVFPTDLAFINYLAITDTVEARGIVSGINSDGQIILEDAHINVWFSCYPREHSANDDIGNDRVVQSNTNGVPGNGWPGETNPIVP
ncbi:hypothetical protein [Dehalogenimonas etheniformans]|uniref:Uncharacterized protein n=1 Tax=Dehalogenimonas etheniformans TaxID=1536648 RepID=A0A2P5P630_9CHLR|nr:hypothetical protein [Dehalogenimonas etheniformans]PPD57729.1 hypothetical protein JP09_008290 [Dehalogenimonas etheniformans]QNT76069.1 hypothetical protein HX448_04865 [Dehalogenimonas etheniformans]